MLRLFAKPKSHVDHNNVKRLPSVFLALQFYRLAHQRTA